MKTTVLAVLATVLASATLSAQQMTYNAGGTSFGLRAGVNFNTINGKDVNGNRYENKIATGFHGGLNAEIPIGSGSYIQPGVLYSQKGAEFEGDNEVRLSYLEVPVNFVYKPILGTGRMLLGFGPYVGFGLSGKSKSANGTEREVHFTKNYDATYTANGDPQYKGIDAGANFLAGYEFAQNLSFQINAQLGLAQLTPGINGSDNPITQKNTGFGLSLGYRF